MKKKSLLAPEKAQQKEAELQERMQKVQQTYARHQQDLGTKEQEATGKIFERMSRIISKIAASENFTMIFDKQQSSVLFAKPHLDLTNELIRRYNAGEGAAPAAAAGASSAPAGGGPAKPAPAAKK